MGGGEHRSARDRAAELVRDAVQRVNLDAIRRFATKRTSGGYRLDTDADRLPLRICAGCSQEVIEGLYSRMGPDMRCHTCQAAVDHDPPRAA